METYYQVASLTSFSVLSEYLLITTHEFDLHCMSRKIFVRVLTDYTFVMEQIFIIM